ncbi:MAG: hypothetical protein ACOCYG_00890 [Spirochaetota bacterium]
MSDHKAPWGEHTDRAVGFLLHLSVFLALFAVVLWPSSSYVSFFRYGNVPILYEFASFVLPLTVALGSAYLGVLSHSPRHPIRRADRADRADKGEKGGVLRRIGAEVLGAVCTAAVTAPMVAIAGAVSRASALTSVEIMLILTTTALAFRPVGLLAQTISPNRSLQYVLLWSLVILAFYLTAYRLPAANPVVAMSNAAEATRIGGASIFFAQIEGYRPLVTAAYHLAGAGFLTVLVVFSGRTVRRVGGAA